MRTAAPFLRALSLLFLAGSAGCGGGATITVTEPSSSTVWLASEGIHTIKWTGAQAQERVFLYKGEEEVSELDLYLGDDGEVVVRHPEVEDGSDYRIRVEDHESNAGFSGFFSIRGQGPP